MDNNNSNNSNITCVLMSNPASNKTLDRAAIQVAKKSKIRPSITEPPRARGGSVDHFSLVR